jgi:protein-tyrosine phosphatase
VKQLSEERVPVRVLMVCLGNICRSPTAHAVFQQKIDNAGLSGLIMVDSAGTGDYHIGHKPDQRSRRAAARRGYSLNGLLARQVRPADFTDFDYILAMDENNQRDLMTLCPKTMQHKIKLFMEYADNNYLAVPDPYYGPNEGFQLVLQLVEEAADALLDHIRKTHRV